MGNQARYVFSNADSKDCQERFSFKSYAAIVTLAVIVWCVNPAPSHATQYICYSLTNHGNRITSHYAGYWNDNYKLSGKPATLPLVRDYCHDSGGGSAYYYGYGYGHGNNGASVLATRAISLSDNADLNDYVQSWDMSQIASKLGCPGGARKINFPGLNQVISLLPTSPKNMRIPTLISKMAGENSLAGNLAIELYSGAWQFLGILTSFKLFKVFFKN